MTLLIASAMTFYDQLPCRRPYCAVMKRQNCQRWGDKRELRSKKKKREVLFEADEEETEQKKQAAVVLTWAIKHVRKAGHGSEERNKSEERASEWVSECHLPELVGMWVIAMRAGLDVPVATSFSRASMSTSPSASSGIISTSTCCRLIACNDHQELWKKVTPQADFILQHAHCACCRHVHNMYNNTLCQAVQLIRIDIDSGYAVLYNAVRWHVMLSCAVLGFIGLDGGNAWKTTCNSQTAKAWTLRIM